jgi:hypothetical protein
MRGVSSYASYACLFCTLSSSARARPAWGRQTTDFLRAWRFRVKRVNFGLLYDVESTRGPQRAGSCTIVVVRARRHLACRYAPGCGDNTIVCNSVKVCITELPPTLPVPLSVPARPPKGRCASQ